MIYNCNNICDIICDINKCFEDDLKLKSTKFVSLVDDFKIFVILLF